jgi:hypothetical protein
VKLWTQAGDSKGSTVSQFHSLTKRHGGVGSEMYGGVVKTGTKGPREQGTEKQEIERPGEGVGAKDGGGKNRDQGTEGTRD